MLAERIFIGGWFQRPTLHLSEIFDFFRHGSSQLALDPEQLKKHQDNLSLAKVEYKIDGMEFLRLRTSGKINIDVFEDGLIILYTNEPIEINHENLQENLKFLIDYYEQKFSPALTYLFSTGAPVPKELADIKTVYPYFFVFDNASREDMRGFLSLIEPDERYFELENEDYDLFRGDRYHIINHKKISLDITRNFIEEQIFLREFKAQLHRYLNLHRIIWEKVDDIKERRKIKGRDIDGVRHKIESYSKTINLIEARMNQMGTYLATREKLAHGDHDLDSFADVIEYRYEALDNTLSYSKDLWQMTKNYVDSALVLLNGLQQEVTSKSLENLTMIMVIGVGTNIFFAMSFEAPPNAYGIMALVSILVVGILGNLLVKWWAKNTSYDYNDPGYDTKIK